MTYIFYEIIINFDIPFHKYAIYFLPLIIITLNCGIILVELP